MTMLPDDPFKKGEVEDLQPDAAAIAAEEAQKAVDEANELQAAALQEVVDNAKKPSDTDTIGADETFISEKDLGILNGE